MKKNNTANKAALDAKQISEALKKSTQNALQDMLNEAISKTLMESEEDEVDTDTDDVDVDNEENENEDSYNVEDVDTENSDECEGENEEGCENGECETPDNEEDSEDDEDWSDMEDYKVGDNDYDFTGVDDDEVLKVYNKLGDDDQIFVKKDEDGNYELKDEETGAEYVIELNGDAEEPEDDFSDEEGDDIELDFDDEEEPEDDGEDIELDFDDEEEPEDDGEDIEIEIGDDEDSEDDDLLNEEDLGYTDSYQKDVMPGLKMNEPADKKNTNDWDAGAPKGNSKPFSGFKNAKSNLFTKTVNEEDMSLAGEDANMEETTELRARHQNVSKVHTPSGHKKNMGKVSHEVSTANEPTPSTVNEETMKKIVAAAKKIQAENKQYKKAVNDIKRSLYEAAVLNVTLGQVVKLLSENTTTKQEKKSIVERFGNVKTIQESKMLYETVSNELNESKKGNLSLDRGFSATNKETLNETTLYQNNPTFNMMNRMDALDNMWKNQK